MEQIDEFLKREVASILLEESSDPRFSLVTITGAKTSSDLHYSIIYFTCHSTAEEANVIMEALNKAAGFIQKNLSSRVKFKFVPKIQFRYDTAFERGDRVLKKIMEIRKEEVFDE